MSEIRPDRPNESVRGKIALTVLAAVLSGFTRAAIDWIVGNVL